MHRRKPAAPTSDNHAPSLAHLVAASSQAGRLAHFIAHNLPIADKTYYLDGMLGYMSAMWIAADLEAILNPKRIPFHGSPNGDSRFCIAFRGWGAIIIELQAAYLALKKHFDQILVHYRWKPLCTGEGCSVFVGVAGAPPAGPTVIRADDVKEIVRPIEGDLVNALANSAAIIQQLIGPFVAPQLPPPLPAPKATDTPLDRRGRLTTLSKTAMEEGWTVSQWIKAADVPRATAYRLFAEDAVLHEVHEALAKPNRQPIKGLISKDKKGRRTVDGEWPDKGKKG